MDGTSTADSQPSNGGGVPWTQPHQPIMNPVLDNFVGLGNPAERSAYEREYAHKRDLDFQRSVLKSLVVSAQSPETPKVGVRAEYKFSNQKKELISAQTSIPGGGQWAEKLKFTTAKELASSVTSSCQWEVEGFVARGAVSELAARIKQGKTTWVLDLASCYRRKVPFLGFACSGGPVVVLTEQNPASFRVSLERAGLLGDEGVSILFWKNCAGAPWPMVMAKAWERCNATGSRLLLIDTLFMFGQASGISENDADAALEMLKPVQEIASRGLGIVVVRHERKSGGEVGEAGRGSSAFGGACDILISLRRPEGRHPETFRELRCLSRFDETPQSLVVEYDLSERCYKVVGDVAAVEGERSKKGILAALPSTEDCAMSVTDLAKELGLARTTLQRALDELHRDGAVSRNGTGRRGNSFRFWASHEEIPEEVVQ